MLFDFRRYELDTFEFARLARERGGRLVLLTDPWLSPIADLADAVLPAQVDGPSPFESLDAHRGARGDPRDRRRTPTGCRRHARLDRYGSIADQWVRPFAARVGAARDDTAHHPNERIGMTQEPVQVAHVGLGAIGREVVRLVLHREDLRLVGVCDIDPALVGTADRLPCWTRTWRAT